MSQLNCFASEADDDTIGLRAVSRRDYKGWKKSLSPGDRRWLDAVNFSADHGNVALIPGPDGSVARAVLGLGSEFRMWDFAAAVSSLPPGQYAIEEALPDDQLDHAALAWALASYKYERYKSNEDPIPRLVWPATVDQAAVRRCYEATALARDLINTPAGDLGPAELATSVTQLAEIHQATCTQIVGEELVERDYPAIYAVGKGSPRAPRLIELRWGDEAAPKVTLVGKGVCFDSGGLDIKSASGMKLMKKDMGGAAMVLALAHMIMDAGLAVRLRVLVPAVENSVSGDAYRPGDVVRTRKGLHVEIGNTDAEGRVILSDALTDACAEEPTLLIDAATLTGAARVALGTELPALFSSDDGWADDIVTRGRTEQDPLWRMPLFTPYKRHLESKIADLNNISSVSQGGAITAALFLQHFVTEKTPWLHIDTMGWNVTSRPGRPAGGEVFGLRAIFAALSNRYAS
ncbi:MAG: leucyl aminopeptidase family protein [Myxococcales bacterium FL481]|nr:MAG: leucyl aminopeptidase family protein [Myxococcales bacterium FL481]